MNGVPRTVVGILPSGFRLPIDFASELPMEVYLPFHVPPGVVEIPRNGGSHGEYAVARLAEGATLDQARGMLLGVLMAPLNQFARTIAEPPAMLARVISARGESEEAA